jgi:hypothetical protein
MVYKDKIKKIFKSPWFNIPLSIIAAFIFFMWLQEPIQDYKLLHTQNPYVAVLITKEATDFKIPNDFNSGFFDNNQEFISTKNGKQVQLKHFEDFLSETESSKLLDKLIDDENCLLIICNANSSMTNSNIDMLMKAKGIPIIMPIATDNTIMKKAKLAQHKGILRILPDNSKQAKTICNFVNSHYFPTDSIKNIVIYGDEDNPAYSINLSREIASQLRKSEKKISIEELIGPSNSVASSAELLKKANLIIYAGVSHHASLLIDQLSLLNLRTPLIMTDGCLVTSILSEASTKYENSFIVSPTTMQGEDQYLLSPYKVIGKVTYALLEKKIISQAFPTRKSIYDRINEIRETSESFAFSDYKFNFDSDGNNIGNDQEGSYYIYPIKEGKVDNQIQIK